MKKVVEEADNKISMLHAENSELKVEKGAIEAELDRNIDETLELLNQSFFQVVPTDSRPLQWSTNVW